VEKVSAGKEGRGEEVRRARGDENRKRARTAAEAKPESG